MHDCLEVRGMWCLCLISLNVDTYMRNGALTYGYVYVGGDEISEQA